MRVAYLVTAYNNPGLLNTLIDLLLDAGGTVFVHLDGKCPLGPRDIVRRDVVRFVDPPVKVYWGDDGFAESVVRLLELALDSGEFDYFHSLSGSDLPIRPVSEFHDWLSELEGCDLLPAKPVDLSRREMRKRLHSYYDIHERTRLALAWQRLRFLVGLHVHQRPLQPGLNLWFGSAWLTVRPETARWLVHNWRDPAMHQAFERMFCVDEVFFPTFIANAPVAKPPCHEDIRFILWQGQGSPKTLTMNDWPALAASDRFFARKFDPVTSAPLIERVLHECLGVTQAIA